VRAKMQKVHRPNDTSIDPTTSSYDKTNQQPYKQGHDKND